MKSFSSPEEILECAVRSKAISGEEMIADGVPTPVMVAGHPTLPQSGRKAADPVSDARDYFWMEGLGASPTWKPFSS